jgi:RecA-family ATPase
MNILDVLGASPPVLDHVLPGLLRGSLGVLVAPGGHGKTMLLTQLACAIAAGLPVFDGVLHKSDAEPAKVVMLLAEESHDTMHHRLHAVAQVMLNRTGVSHLKLGARLAENLLLHALAGSALLKIDRAGVPSEELLDACEGARLVILDPLRLFHDEAENDSQGMALVVRWLQALARASNAAVLVAHHANRNSMVTGGGEQASAARGSTALTDGARWQANLSPLSDIQARSLRLADEERAGYVRFDISKSNYTGHLPPVIFQRQPESGVLVPVLEPVMAPKKAAPRSRSRA